MADQDRDKISCSGTSIRSLHSSAGIELQWNDLTADI